MILYSVWFIFKNFTISEDYVSNFQNLTPGDGTINIIYFKNNEVIPSTISYTLSPIRVIQVSICEKGHALNLLIIQISRYSGFHHTFYRSPQ